MKKLLLASSMLVCVAGQSFADVSVSGDGRMGIVSKDGESEIVSRIRIKFSASGTTDSGLTFGGSVRADNAGDGADGTAGSVYLSGGFGSLSMGDVDSADNAAVGQLAGVGYTGLGDSNEVQYSADGFSLFDLDKDLLAAAKDFDSNHSSSSLQTRISEITITSPVSKVLYTYSAGSLTATVSASDIGDQQAYAAGVSYAAGSLTLAAGYGTAEASVATTKNSVTTTDTYDVTDTTASASYVMGSTTIKGIYQDKQVDGTGSTTGSLTETSYGASVVHAMGAISVTGFAISADLHDGIFGDDDLTLTRYGAGASYDLGGGAKVTGGVARVDFADVAYGATKDDIIDSTDTQTVYDLGVTFAF